MKRATVAALALGLSFDTASAAEPFFIGAWGMTRDCDIPVVFTRDKILWDGTNCDILNTEIDGEQAVLQVSCFYEESETAVLESLFVEAFGQIAVRIKNAQSVGSMPPTLFRCSPVSPPKGEGPEKGA